MPRLDPHSYANSDQPATRHLKWRARVDFVRHVLEAEAELHFEAPIHGPLDLDTRGLEIAGVHDEAGSSIPYTVAAAEPILGSRLHLDISVPTARVRITYNTSPEASALQWLSREQTDCGRQPFLFSQCQAIHARSVVPLQDTPRIRITYDATLLVPSSLRGLMAATFVSRETRMDEPVALERYQMRHPIPPYLFAFAVGELVSKDVGPRSRVWAEPTTIERAAWEFEKVDEMLTLAEKLFGPYDWDRFDILTMPSSFPYGGMENPCLTFITPTLLAGDRSLVNVVAHELAHSWTGNLVSNANAEHFWLNEGFTVFAERRIQEALEGTDMAALHAAIGRRGLEEAVAHFADRPQMTHLRTRMQGIDPDEVYSLVPYEKGYLFLKLLEERAGRAAFDRFLHHYIETFRFRAITTQDFVDLAAHHMPGTLAAVDADEWLYGPGIPSNAPVPHSERMRAVLSMCERMPDEAQSKAWSPAEWQLYLERLPHPASRSLCESLDERFHLTESGNFEILFSWLTLAAMSGYHPAVPRMESALGQVGRMKFLKPLYSALTASPDLRDVATRCFTRYRAGYHPIAQQVLSQMLETAPVP